MKLQLHTGGALFNLRDTHHDGELNTKVKCSPHSYLETQAGQIKITDVDLTTKAMSLERPDICSQLHTCSLLFLHQGLHFYC